VPTKPSIPTGRLLINKHDPADLAPHISVALVPEEALETRGGVPVAPGPWGSQDISVDPAAARPKIENRDANTTLEPRRKRWVVSQFEFLHRVVSGHSRGGGFEREFR
jgi:hypothetical protein